MSSETAVRVLAGIITVGGIVWVFALRFLSLATRAGQVARQPVGDDPDQATLPPGWVGGSAEVEGEPGSLATRAAAIMARGNFKIVEKTDDRLRFQRVDVAAVNQSPDRWIRQGELRFTPLRSGRTRVQWAIELGSMRWLLRLGAGFLILGFLALAVGGWLLYTLVATSADPEVRWQTVQMVQAIHFLWPPFLFGALYLRVMRGVAAQFEALAGNLPYV